MARSPLPRDDTKTRIGSLLNWWPLMSFRACSTTEWN